MSHNGITDGLSAASDWAHHAAVPAVMAGFPLLECLRTCRVQTQAGAPAYGRAPFNTLGHSAERWTARDRDIVTPSNDLLYSNAWIDLRHGPVLLTAPPQTGRFFVMQLLDAYTENFLNIGTRNTPAAGGCFALVGPGFAGALPPGTIEVRCPTSLVWLLGRVLVDSDEDVPAARAFQSGFRLDGRIGEAPPPSIALWQSGGDEALDFFANLARALTDFPPAPAEGAAFDLLAGAHGMPAADGSLERLRPVALGGLRRAHEAGMRMIESLASHPSKAPWRFGRRVGRYGGDLMARATVAWKGLAALAPDEAVYAISDHDAQGQRLSGSHAYRIHFEDGGQVPADAFWSITVYGDDRFLAANDIGRHALGNRSALVPNPDGSLTLRLSHEPAGGPQQNWLPVPAGGFYLIARLYHPRESFLQGRYRLPAVERAA